METKIAADEENSAEEFWVSVQNDPSAPAELSDLPVTVTAARAEEIRRWCESAPGWNDGPRYAPTALLFYDDA